MNSIFSFLKKNLIQFTQIFSYSNQLVEIIKEEEPDIIYIHEFKALVAISLIFNKNKKFFNNKIIIYDAHEIEAYRNPPKNFLLKFLINKIELRTLQKLKSKLISVSNPICYFYSRKIKKELVYLIKNYPSQINFFFKGSESTPIDSDNKKNEIINYNSDCNLLGIFVGNLTINRGIEELLHLISYFPSVKIFFIGKISSDKFYNYINKLINALNLTHQVHFIPPIQNHKLVSFIQKADFSFIPILPITLSYFFCSPNKLHESKAAQLPIFAQSLPEFEIELNINKLNPIGKTTNFFDILESKRDFENFLSNLKIYKDNYKFIKPKYFDDDDQFFLYEKLLEN